MKMTVRQEQIMADLVIGHVPEIVTNPFSGESVMLEPEAVALYDFITGCQLVGGSQKDFDAARYLFQARWPKEYMKLLD